MTPRRSAVERLLRRHACADEAEAHAVAATLELLGAVEDPFARTTLPGHITASAIVLDESAMHVLVVWHAALQRWLQPGGHCDPDDPSPEHTARRELSEETGVHAESRAGNARLVHVDVHDIPARGAEPAHRHHDLRFVLRVPFACAEALRSGAASGWVPLEALARLGVDASFARAVARAVRESASSAGQAHAASPN